MFHKQIAQDVMHEKVLCSDEAVNQQLPTSESYK